MWTQVQRQVKPDDCEDVAKRVQWKYKGMVVCNPFWCHAHYSRHETVDYMKLLVKKGRDTVPPMLPTMKKPTVKLEVEDG